MIQLARRSLAKGLAGTGLAALLTPSVLAQIVKGAAPADLSFVHPELRPVARMFLAGQQAAVFQKVVNRPPLAAPRHEMRMVKVPAAPDVPVYVINAERGARRAAILHMHGGGFVAGSAKGSVRPLQEVAAELDCVCATVEYRLAPGTTFAGSMEDNYAALRWLHQNAAELGVDPNRIAVMGDSAGGTHAALVALLARDRGEVPLMFQLLNYAALDDRTGVTLNPSYPIGAIDVSGSRSGDGWRAFLGQQPGTANVPARAVPMRHANLKGLPPAFVGVGSIDRLVDENIRFANRLIDSGVPTQLVVVPGAYHAFDGLAADTAVARWYIAAKLDALRQAFAGAWRDVRVR
jgi:acetyl esterase/lipase